jgi:phosphatidylserine decarboxylase
MGRFNMGSTVILLAPKGVLTWDASIVAGKPLRMGERLATIER